MSKRQQSSDSSWWVGKSRTELQAAATERAKAVQAKGEKNPGPLDKDQIEHIESQQRFERRGSQRKPVAAAQPKPKPSAAAMAQELMRRLNPLAGAFRDIPWAAGSRSEGDQ